MDDHIPTLLAFHPSVRFHEDESWSSGRIILQDKASCFPAAVLSPPAEDGAYVIDATAAPGNKTTHLSALMQNRGKVGTSFSTRRCRSSQSTPPAERDKKRFATLRTMIAKGVLHERRAYQHGLPDHRSF